MKSFFSFGCLMSLLAIIAPKAEAHFPWLAINADGNAMYFFGENIANRNYKLPEKIEQAEVIALQNDEASSPLASSPLAMSKVESENFIGKLSSASVKQGTSLTSRITFGIHGGAKLDYYSQFIAGPLPKSFETAGTQFVDLNLNCQVIVTETGVAVRVHWKDKPVSDAEVHLFCERGHEKGLEKTNELGEVKFTDRQLESGLNGIMVGHTFQETGKFENREYKSAVHYLTATFVNPNDASSTTSSLDRKSLDAVLPLAVTAKQTQNSKLQSIAIEKPFADMPLTVTSFGACRLGDHIYVYGGHTGESHHYSVQEQSDQLLALDVTKSGAEWKVISNGPRLQGLALVSFGGKLIRIGGFQATNKENEDHCLVSSSEVAVYDTLAGTWSSLPSLPEPRSSHDAMIVGDRVYVVGGWTLEGKETSWLTTAWSMNLSSPVKQWESIPEPPFTRRAVSLATLGDRLYAIGGMTEKSSPTTEVAYFDTTNSVWNTAPALHGRPMNGFGTAAWPVQNAIVATTIDGDILRLTRDSKDWEQIGKTRDARFFHRLLPIASDRLVALGGANMEKGKFNELELITILPD